MSDSKIVRIRLPTGLAVVAALLVGATTFVSAQEAATREGQSAFPIRHPSGVELTEQQVRGAGVFFQRCSLCHLAKAGAGGSKYCCVSSLGPDLSGRFKNVTPDQEKAFKDIILNGGPTYMPSWKFGLSLEEIDDIIAYLKTLS